jgi:hypothetical protein
MRPGSTKIAAFIWGKGLDLEWQRGVAEALGAGRPTTIDGRSSVVCFEKRTLRYERRRAGSHADPGLLCYRVQIAGWLFQTERRPCSRPTSVGKLSKPRTKSTPKTRVGALAAARHAGGNNKQSHWMDRLKAVMKQRVKAKTKSLAR